MMKIIFNPGRNKEVPFSLVKRIVNLAAKNISKINGQVEINLVSAKKIQELNYHYRGKNQITDVLSFAWQEDSYIVSDMLGQIFICPPQIKKQSKEFGVSFKEEFARMLVHGLLHLVGYDHQIEKEEKIMFFNQEKIVDYVFS